MWESSSHLCCLTDMRCLWEDLHYAEIIAQQSLEQQIHTNTSGQARSSSVAHEMIFQANNVLFWDLCWTSLSHVSVLSYPLHLLLTFMYEA